MLVLNWITDLLVRTKAVDDSDLTYAEMFGAGRGSFCDSRGGWCLPAIDT